MSALRRFPTRWAYEDPFKLLVADNLWPDAWLYEAYHEYMDTSSNWTTDSFTNLANRMSVVNPRLRELMATSSDGVWHQSLAAVGDYPKIDLSPTDELGMNRDYSLRMTTFLTPRWKQEDGEFIFSVDGQARYFRIIPYFNRTVVTASNKLMSRMKVREGSKAPVSFVIDYYFKEDE